MAIKVGGVTVINDSRGLENITSGLSAEVRKPDITFPANGATGFDAISAPNIQVIAPYNHLYNLTKKGTEVQISVNSDFSSPIVDADEVGTATTFNYDSSTYSFATSTLYYVRVRHYDVNDIYSEYSDTISFTTPATFVFANQPSITSPANSATEILGNPLISASAFATTPSGQDTHVSSDWQIATDAGFTTIVDSSITDTTNLTSYTVQTVLAVSTVHYARVRYNGATYTSEYSDTITFTTAAQYQSYWMMLSTDVEEFGGSYRSPNAAAIDDSTANSGAGKNSWIAMGGRNSGTNSFKAFRIGEDGEDEGAIWYGSPFSSSSIYGMGAIQINSTTAAIGMHWNGDDRAYISFIDIANGTFTENATYKVEATNVAGTAMRGLDPGGVMVPGSTSNGVWALGPTTSNYRSYFLYELNDAGTIVNNQELYVASGDSIFARGMTKRANGELIVVGEYRNSSNQAHFFIHRWNSTASSLLSADILTGPSQGYSGGNNMSASLLSNGNILVTDWQFTAEVSFSSGTQVVRHLSIARSDRAYENAAGNIVISTSQTTPVIFEYQPNGTGYTLLNKRELIFPVSGSGSSDEWSGSVYRAEGDILFLHGRYYTGSQYNGYLHKVPASISDLDATGATFPNNTQFAWTSTSSLPSVQSVTASVSTHTGLNARSPSMTVTTISQTTTEDQAQGRVGGNGNVYEFE